MQNHSLIGVPGNVGFGHFKDRINLFPSNGRKILQELLHRITPLEMIEQRCDWNARARETRQAPLNLGINCYRNHGFHILSISHPAWNRAPKKALLLAAAALDIYVKLTEILRWSLDLKLLGGQQLHRAI
jgi:hypothetical protein